MAEFVDGANESDDLEAPFSPDAESLEFDESESAISPITGKPMPSGLGALEGMIGQPDPLGPLSGLIGRRSRDPLMSEEWANEESKF